VSVIGAIRLVELGLKVYVFKGADVYEYSKPYPQTVNDGLQVSSEEAKKAEFEEKTLQERENKRQRQREISGASAMILIGFPLYLYHWKTIQKENKKR